MWDASDPARIDPACEIRTISFENPRGERGAAGTAAGGRKGAPSRFLQTGERVALAEIAGPGRVRHIWMTFPPMPPESMRALALEVFYDDASDPSVSVPCLDFFGLPHGRPVAYSSALAAAQEGRGFNAWLPLPFRRRIRIELHNGSTRRFPFYYQVAYTLGRDADEVGVLHASFRRENPTALRRDFPIAEGLRGPGRFLGCNVGVRVLQDGDFSWYGEGEVKMYLDGDGPYPTWCGTGLEDYVGSAWGMGAHATPLQGAPLVVQRPDGGARMPDFVGFYRWHLPDPIVFRESLRVTIQQIGAVAVPRGDNALRRRIERGRRLAGTGWYEFARGPLEAFAICERQDDYCATAFVYCRDAQPVPRLDLASATADLARLPYEQPGPFELALGVFSS
ncbi:MAG TPA: glycoside hydrolase family 172 protein [Myxococcota bacterium]|nr:glycoside hydrolase family 172 protein [Myxococcota bacterium]